MFQNQDVRANIARPITHSHGSARVLKGRRRKSMGKRENGKFDPFHPEPLNRSSQEVAHVIMSWISTDMQNLVAIPPGVSFPRMCEIAHQNGYSASFFGFFQRATA